MSWVCHGRPQVLETSRSSHGSYALAGLALCAMAGRDHAAAKQLVEALKAEFPASLQDPIVKQACTAVTHPTLTLMRNKGCRS